MTLWNKFENNFNNIIRDIKEYEDIYNFAVMYEYNIILYMGMMGYPIDLFIDEIIRKKFNIKGHIYKKENLWNKSIIYNENQYFFEIDLGNPYMPKKLNLLIDMILYIIKTRPIIIGCKHLIVIKQIDKLMDEYAFALRIVLERYYNNCYFICTTTRLSKIESPIKSRFSLIRVRLFKTDEIKMIFNKYLDRELNHNLVKNGCRDIIFSIFIGQTEIYEPLLVDENFCNLNYPPLKDFIKTNYNLTDIRQLSYKYCQYNLTIKDIIMDFLHINKKDYKEILKNGVEVEHLLSRTNKGREPIYIEALLCQILIKK
jgi:hypothetical protein